MEICIVSFGLGVTGTNNLSSGLLGSPVYSIPELFVPNERGISNKLVKGFQNYDVWKLGNIL